MATDRADARSPFAVAMAGYLKEQMLLAGACTGSTMNGKELAARADIGQSSISRTLNAQRDITAEELAAVCRVLGLEPTDVLAEVIRRSTPVATRSSSTSASSPRTAASRRTKSS